MNDDTPPSFSRRTFLAAAALASAGAFGARAEEEQAMRHVVLLGDSIFDNKAYVGDGPDVIEQLTAALPQGWDATLAAIDGATTVDVARQLAELPRTATHLVVSAGGNDALKQEEVLEARADSVGAALDKLAKVKAKFQKSYAAMLDALTRTELPVAACTIYDSNYEDPDRRRIANAALAVFNDAITREVFARGLPLIDLRLIFDTAADYANPIEPSVEGGAKLATVITRAVTTHDFKQKRSEVFAG